MSKLAIILTIANFYIRNLIRLMSSAISLWRPDMGCRKEKG